jgi:glycosyltransferase involved in cell wall biosynthesis
MARLLGAFDLWMRQQKEENVLLVLAGFLGNDAKAIQDYLSARPALRSRVLMPGFIPDFDLRSLYSAALAFVYPSLDEGFGLPVLEAMQCGVPVAVSRGGALEEVAGSSGLLFDPASAESIAAALHDLFTDSQRRESLSRLGLERAKDYSWELTADKLIEVYSR